MSPEHFLQVADLLRDPVMLVTTKREILAANVRARSIFDWPTELDGIDLGDIVESDSKSLAAYLRSCARSREPVVSGLAFRVGEETRQFRCHGAILAASTSDAPARLMLTLTSQDVGNQPFIALNQKLDELAREIELRKSTELELQEHLKLSEFGREFGLALSQSGSLDDMLNSCTDLMVKHLSAAFARIWILEDSSQHLVLRASSGLYTHLDGSHGRIPIGHLKIGYIAQSKQPHLTNQVIGDSRVNEQEWARREGMVAFAGYPLIVDGATIGVMAMFARQILPDSVVAAMGSVANELAVGVRRKRAEESLLVKARALELADSRKNEFLAMLAHELRNPLAPIRSGLELLHNEQPDSDLLPVMQAQVEHIVRIVDDLLDVSRIMRGRIEMRKHPVRLKTILERSLAAIMPAAAPARHELQIASVSDDIWVLGDTIRLTQVVSNLLHNAVKYTPAGGRIQVDVATDDQRVTLQVIDNGMGIDPEFAPELFTLFAQASRTLDRAQGGLGIGLTLVKQIVSLHGGQVTATSAGIGQGSTFTIHLPLTEAGVEETPPPDGDGQTPVPRFRVLIVDDNAASAKILARLIEKNWEHNVAIEFDGARAVAAADKQRSEIIFLDIGLPGLSGYDVAKALRGKPEFKDAFIVALTGYGTDEDRKKSSAAGFNMHLVKPIGIDDVRKIFSICSSRTPASS